MDSLTTVEKEVEKALESFSAFYESIDEDIDSTIEFVLANINELNRIESDASFRSYSFLTCQQVRDRIREFSKKYSDKHKDLHGTISKIGKVIDKSFVSDCGNWPQIDLLDTAEKRNVLNQVICEHFLRRGCIDVADTLSAEADITTSEINRHLFVEMDFILQSIRQRDLQPALEWCKRHREQLTETHSQLEFNLHRLNFIKIIENGTKNQREALLYSRNFTPFASTCKKEIQQLMAALLYVNSGLENSPYSKLLNPDAWGDIGDEFMKNVSKLMGLPVECPLSICVNAGCKAIPALINIVQVMQATQVTHILSKDELPIEIDLGSNNRYHSVFACPILRQQSTDNNPPMRLVCGHVISKDALTKLTSGGKLKCPYCPIEMSPNDAKQISF